MLLTTQTSSHIKPATAFLGFGIKSTNDTGLPESCQPIVRIFGDGVWGYLRSSANSKNSAAASKAIQRARLLSNAAKQHVKSRKNADGVGHQKYGPGCQAA